MNAARPPEVELSVSIRVACYYPEHPCSINDLLPEVDELMYEQKKKKATSAS